MKVKAAKSWGYAASTFILGKQPKKPGKMDLLLAEAEHLLESERCPQCGQPKYVCQSESDDIDFSVFTETCQATARRERREKEYRKKGKDLPAGLVFGVEAFTHSGVDLTEHRDEYYDHVLEVRDSRDRARPKGRINPNAG